MWEMKVAKIKSDEWMIIRKDENDNTEYLTRKWTWSRRKIDGMLFFHEHDAISTLIIKRRKGEIPEDFTPVEEPINPFEKEYQSWSELSSRR